MNNNEVAHSAIKNIVEDSAIKNIVEDYNTE